MFKFNKQGKLERFAKNALEFMKSRGFKSFEMPFREVNNGVISAQKIIKISIQDYPENPDLPF